MRHPPKVEIVGSNPAGHAIFFCGAIMHKFLIILLLLSGCNSVNLKPHTLERESVVYAQRGGYTIGRAIKQEMEHRGYTVRVGRATSNQNINGDETDIDIDKTIIPSDAKYIVTIREYRDKYRPIWCSLNGIWWWDFSVSIAVQDTGEEILTWHGRGCQNSSTRVFDRILDKLEI